MQNDVIHVLYYKYFDFQHNMFFFIPICQIIRGLHKAVYLLTPLTRDTIDYEQSFFKSGLHWMQSHSFKLEVMLFDLQRDWGDM